MGDPGLFGPESVAWRVHADPSMLVGGLRAVLIQALHPLVMGGVDQHSDYRTDPWGRLERTTAYVVTTTFGDTDSALRAVRRVRRMHRGVRGVEPETGLAYDARDPDLLLWVHGVEVHSFLAAYRRYGGSLSAAEADRYVAEMARVGELVGIPPDLVPRSTADLRAYLDGVEGLQITEAARQGLRMILLPPMPLPLRPLWALPVSAAVGLVPRRLRAMYGLPWFWPADPAVQVTTLALNRALRLLLPDPPALRAAQARVRVEAEDPAA